MSFLVCVVLNFRGLSNKDHGAIQLSENAQISSEGLFVYCLSHNALVSSHKTTSI